MSDSGGSLPQQPRPPGGRPWPLPRSPLAESPKGRGGDGASREGQNRRAEPARSRAQGGKSDRTSVREYLTSEEPWLGKLPFCSPARSVYPSDRIDQLSHGAADTQSPATPPLLPPKTLAAPDNSRDLVSPFFIKGCQAVHGPPPHSAVGSAA